MVSAAGVGQKGVKIKVELAVNFTGQKDLDRIRQALESQGTSLVASDLQGKTIQVELYKTTTKSTDEQQQALDNIQSLQRFIEKQTGLMVVVKGIGQISSAIAELGPPQPQSSATTRLMGVVRLTQLPQGQCFFDGLIDGFQRSQKQQFRATAANGKDDQYKLVVHEFGDLSSPSFESIGEPVVEIHSQPVATITSGSMSVRSLVPDCDVVSMIGKSIALTEHSANSRNKIFSAGVIARASTVQGNEKRICSCSGATIWQERLDAKQKEAGQQ